MPQFKFVMCHISGQGRVWKEKIYFWSLFLPPSFFLELHISIFLSLFFAEKNSIFLVFPFEEISMRQELSSLPHFRIQGGTLSMTQEQEQQ